MKLNQILDNLNSFEKNAFLKILDSIISDSKIKRKEIDKILSHSEKDLKNADNIKISKVFDLVQDDFQEYVRSEFKDTNTQLDILIDIIIRDGNCIMKAEWLSRLYENELKTLKKKIKDLEKSISEDNSSIDNPRVRDYNIYKNCLESAFTNDLDNNLERKITQDELSILLTLSKQLELSQEEIKLINYMIIPAVKKETETIINELKNIGVIFYSKKSNTVFVANEIVRLLRRIRNKPIADKYYRRVLKCLREPQINLACRKHNIKWKDESVAFKIKAIIKEGIPFKGLLLNDIFKEGVSLTEKKNFLNDLFEKGLKTGVSLKGSTSDEKINNIISYFEDIDKDEQVGISIEGYERLLIDLDRNLPKTNEYLKSQFELQDNQILKSEYLLNYNIKPRDVLEILNESDLTKFCEKQDIKTRGNEVYNILEEYKDAENLSLENYELFAYRDLKGLKENGLNIPEAEIGVQFESLTKRIFSDLKFNVDEDLRNQLNTTKDKIDILLNLGNNQLILVECKTSKDKGFNKFSTVSRQLKAYVKLAEKNSFNIIKSLLIAPEFSDDFVSECNLEYELNLSLIKASSFLNILEAFKESNKHKEFPYNLLMKDVVIQEERITKALLK